MADKNTLQENDGAPAELEDVLRAVRPGTPAVEIRLALEDLAQLISEYKNEVIPVFSISGVLTINCALGDYLTTTLSEDITSIVFTNLPPAGKGVTKWLTVTNGSGPYDITWPASFKWASAAGAGVLTPTNGAIDNVVFTSVDQGTTWFATISNDQA